MLEFLGPVHRVDRHHHRIGAQNAEMRDHQLRAVLHQQHHAVAGPHAQALQVGSKSFGLRHQLRVVGLPAKEVNRSFAGIAPRAGGQVVP